MSTPVDIADLLAEREWLHRLAHRLVADAGTADDLVQETWLAALVRPPRHSRGLRGWLATVLRNRAHDARRRDRRATRDAERSAPPAPPDDPAEVVARAEMEQRVARLTLDLPEPKRVALLMRYHRGLSSTEIAARLGVPAGTVRSRLKRGLDQLRARLDRDHDGDRRTWAIALAPLALRAPRRGALMLTAPVKIGVAALLLGVLGSGTALILAAPEADSPSTAVTAADAERAAPRETEAHVAATTASQPAAPGPAPVHEAGSPSGGVNEDEQPAGSEERKEEEEGAKASILDRKIDVSFEGVSIVDALDRIRVLTGLQYELDPGLRESAANATCTLKVNGLAVRDVLSLLVAYTAREGALWEEKSEGYVVIRQKPAKPSPPKPAPARPWFGGRGMFPSRPETVPDRAVPPIAMPQVEAAKPLPADVLSGAIEIRMAADGSLFAGEKLIPGGFGLWRLLLDRPDAPVLIRADASAPFAALREVRRLARSRNVFLAIGETNGVAVPPRVRPGRNATKAPAESTVGEVATLLIEAESHDSSAAGALSPTDRAALIAGRKGRRGLRSSGGGGTQAAVSRGLAWLAANQGEDGSWPGGAEATALALLAFLASGEADREGPHASTVAAGLAWLETSREPWGATTTAFAEAWALTGDVRWRRAAEAAATRTRSALALRLARSCSVSVTIPSGPERGTSPAACFARILDGEAPTGSESLATSLNAFLERTRDDPTALLDADDDLLHDGSLAAFQAGGQAWLHWNVAMKEAVVGSQVTEGPEAGSWAPPEGGSRVRTTARRTATLTVYFRYRRLFSN